MPPTTDLNIATYDFRNPEERARFNEQELRRIQETVGKHLEELKAQGIIDEQGRRIRTDIPPAMLPDSDADVGG